MTNITKSNEDYLETILLFENNNAAKSIDVANALGVSKAAVSIAMNDLIKKDLITKESYGDIILTPLGRGIATSILSKHKLIKKILIGIGVSEENAENECCKIEHILSDETINCLKEVCQRNDFC
ncbi:MAG: metal-dependent transcriptional regulator [Clostridia bacterium]